MDRSLPFSFHANHPISPDCSCQRVAALTDTVVMAKLKFVGRVRYKELPCDKAKAMENDYPGRQAMHSEDKGIGTALLLPVGYVAGVILELLVSALALVALPVAMVFELFDSSTA